LNRRYANPVACSFGLDAAPMLTTRSLRGQQFFATHIVCGPEQIGMSAQVDPEDTFHVSISLTDMPLHELWCDGRPFISEGWAKNAMRIVDMKEGAFAARIFHPHEGVGFYMPRMSLDGFTDEAWGRRGTNPSCPPGTVDLILAHLVRTLLPAFARPQEASILFVDHVMLAVCTHLVERYGSLIIHSAALRRGGLTPAQTARAKELLASSLRGELFVADIAKECGLSRQHFIRAFKKTVGCAPHQWQQQRKVELVKGLLINTRMPIRQIALKVGFADQSHLTRVFKALVGEVPVAWRRQHSKFVDRSE